MALAIETAGQAGRQQALPPERGCGAAPGKQRQVVHALQLVRGKPFYGYHMEEQLYIKVVL